MMATMSFKSTIKCIAIGLPFLDRSKQQASNRQALYPYLQEVSLVDDNCCMILTLMVLATPGMHYPESRFYIRRVRLSNTSPLLQPLIDAGYPIETCVVHPKDTVVVGIPVDVGEGVRTQSDLSMWEQLSLAAFLQSHWADNQVRFIHHRLTLILTLFCR